MVIAANESHEFVLKDLRVDAGLLLGLCLNDSRPKADCRRLLLDH